MGNPSLITVNEEEYLRVSGTCTYTDDFESFFDNQYFGGDDLPAGLADTSLPASYVSTRESSFRAHDLDSKPAKRRLTISRVAKKHSLVPLKITCAHEQPNLLELVERDSNGAEIDWV